jgi:DinB superfamily
MSIATHIKTALNLPSFAVQSYLQDLTDDQLFVRPHPKANHIAWQLGHLIASEHDLNNMVCPNSMPPLPAGFAAKHTKETAASDDKSAFCTKAEYLKIMAEQRAGTLAVLDRLSDADLEKPAPEPIQKFGATVGAVIAGQCAHWMMHTGQWVIVRRQLGKEPLF